MQREILMQDKGFLDEVKQVILNDLQLKVTSEPITPTTSEIDHSPKQINNETPEVQEETEEIEKESQETQNSQTDDKYGDIDPSSIFEDNNNN